MTNAPLAGAIGALVGVACMAVVLWASIGIYNLADRLMRAVENRRAARPGRDAEDDGLAACRAIDALGTAGPCCRQDHDD